MSKISGGIHEMMIHTHELQPGFFEKFPSSNIVSYEIEDAMNHKLFRRINRKVLL